MCSQSHLFSVVKNRILSACITAAMLEIMMLVVVALSLRAARRCIVAKSRAEAASSKMTMRGLPTDLDKLRQLKRTLLALLVGWTKLWQLKSSA